MKRASLRGIRRIRTALQHCRFRLRMEPAEQSEPRRHALLDMGLSILRWSVTLPYVLDGHGVS